MKVATERLLEEQIAVVVVLESGKKEDAMWHVPQCYVTMSTMVPLRLYVLYFGMKFKLFTKWQLTIEI